MSYSMHIYLVMATLGSLKATETTPEAELPDLLEPGLQRLSQLVQNFLQQAITPKATFCLEQQLQSELRELGRLALQWTYNHIEPQDTAALPAHVLFEAAPYTRLRHKTPQEVATFFGKIRLWRTGYRPTQKTGDPTVFPLAQVLGLVGGATPALVERVAHYQAEAGANQRLTLRRLRQDHQVDWGVKKLRQVTATASAALDEQRHEVQVEQLLRLLEQATASTGKHRPVLSVGRDGITLGLQLRGFAIWEVATTATFTVLDRRGRRLGSVYLAYAPQPGQKMMSTQMTRLLTEVLRRWPGALPRLAYVTDAGDNETTYYDKVLRRMAHPRTGERLEWIRVLDYYHVSERLWAMAEALWGTGPKVWSWVRKMQKLVLKPGGAYRVLHSAAALRSRGKLRGERARKFRTAYNYLRDRLRYVR